MQKSAVHQDFEADKGADTFREFIVDILGCLVPGNVFLFFLIPALVIPVIASLHLIPRFSTAPALSGVAIEHGSSVHIASLLLILIPALAFWAMLSYVVGFFFYRQTPTRPDRKSFKRIPKRRYRDGMCRKRSDGTTPVEFPYHFLKEYLNDREIRYLANRIPWNGEDDNRRSKHFANALKIRIKLVSPEAYSIIATNEAHIRLASSMWYALRVLSIYSLLGLTIYIGTAATVGWAMETIVISPAVALLPLAVLIISRVGLRGIEETFHYQREREVLFILEVADWLCASNRSPEIFEGLTSERVADAAPGQ